MIVGGVLGGVIGHEIAGRGDKTLGTVAGAAVGAVAGALLPVVSWPLGLLAGAGFMFYKRLRP